MKSEFNKSWLEGLSPSQIIIPQTVIKPQILIRFLDLTSLNATDTPQRIGKLLGDVTVNVGNEKLNVAAVCVYQPFIQQCKAALAYKTIQVATVAGGFPFGQQDLHIKLEDIKRSVALGADEIDVVINRAYPLTEKWQSLFEEVKACKAAAASAKLKVIMGTGDLMNQRLIAKTSMTCMMAGADFIKTSSGFEKVNATLEAGMAMTRAINNYYLKTGRRVGLKPAGGIRTLKEATGWYNLVNQELGKQWLTPKLFRIGASSLLDNLKKEIELS